jgi:chorismate synthase
MSFNTFGKIFRFTTWGESHGPAIGCIVDGCPPNIRLSEKDIQKDMNRRRPGRSKFVSQRKESDKITILSGVFNGKTTGTPISIIISNEDKRSEIMSQLKISLDLDMQILHILKNMELETTEVVVVSRQEKPLLEWLLVPSQN